MPDGFPALFLMIEICPMDRKISALIIFVAAYILFVALPRRRSWIAMAGAALVIAVGVLSPSEAFRAVNWNVMGVFVGTLVLADLFVESRMPAVLAENIVNHSGNTCLAILFICALTAVISAFVENVATLIIIAPIAFALARKLDIHPVKPLIAIAISSNLQGAATLIGDPPSMLLAGFARLNFMDFFIYKGRPSIFFAVQAGALASFLFLYMVFRKERRRNEMLSEEKLRSVFPSLMLVALILALAFSSFVDPGFSWLAGILCMACAVFGGMWDLLKYRGSFLRRIRMLDWGTTFFLIGVFVLVGAITESGWTETLANALSAKLGANVFMGFAALVLISVAISAVVDNVPFLAAMLPVVMLMASKLEMDPTLYLFGLLLGTSIGGNITPIGAAANIVCVGLLKKEGYNLRFGEFVKLGLPFTIISVAASCAFVWIFWAP